MISTHSIHKYIKYNSKWNQMTKHSTKNKLERITARVHKDKLYVQNGSTKEIFCYDPTKNKHISKLEFDTSSIASNCALVSVNDTIHIIGGWRGNKHLVWNPQKIESDNSIEVMHQFTEANVQILGTTAIYVPSTQTLLAIGGFIWDGIDSDTPAVGFGIWRCCLKSWEWQKIFDGDIFGYYTVKAALSSDEQYVIIGSGGIINRNTSDTMYVLDLREANKYKLKECEIKCPIQGIMNLVILGDALRDNLLVIGWIRDLFKKNEFEDLCTGTCIPPMEIMELIVFGLIER